MKNVRLGWVISWKGAALLIAYLEGIEAEAIVLVGARDTGKGLW
ncbi:MULTISPECIES: hypothetical protein [unclassified Bartonella]